MANRSQQAAPDRNAEPQRADQQDQEHIRKRDQDVGDDLCQDQFPVADGGHDQLFDRAAFAFPYDGKGRQARGGLEQDHGDQAGDDIVGAEQVGVVKHACAHIHRGGRSTAGAAHQGQLLQAQADPVRLAGQRCRGKHRTGRGRVGAIDHDRHLRRTCLKAGCR